MSKKQIEIMDVTIRDGSYLIDFAYTPEQIENIVRLIDEAGVKYIEASHGLGIGSAKYGFPHGASDTEYAKAAYRGKKNSKIGAIGHWRGTTLEEIDSITEYIDFFRIITGAHEVEKAKKYIDHCRRSGILSVVQMSRTPSVSPKAAAEAAAKLSDFGADMVYLVDTTGCMMAGEPTEYVKKAKKKVKKMVGFHAHNMLQLALSNTLEAIEAGADIVDASIMGVGRDLGNAAIEALIIVLEKMGIESGISFKKLMKAFEYLLPIFANTKRPDWYVTYLASFRRDIYPLCLIDILSTECKKTPFEVIETLVAMEDVIECGAEELKRLIIELGGDPDEIFKRYQIKALS